MEWLVGPILLIAALSFFAWRLERKKVDSPAAWGAIVIGALFSLLWLRGWLGNALLLTLLGLASLEHIPSWVFYSAGIGFAVFICWYFFNLMGNALIELAREIKETNSRIDRMENSISDKLDDIASRLPGGE